MWFFFRILNSPSNWRRKREEKKNTRIKWGELELKYMWDFTSHNIIINSMSVVGRRSLLLSTVEVSLSRLHVPSLLFSLESKSRLKIIVSLLACSPVVHILNWIMLKKKKTTGKKEELVAVTVTGSLTMMSDEDSIDDYDEWHRKSLARLWSGKS